jgi:hypothetical protein
LIRHAALSALRALARLTAALALVSHSAALPALPALLRALARLIAALALVGHAALLARAGLTAALPALALAGHAALLALAALRPLPLSAGLRRVVTLVALVLLLLVLVALLRHVHLLFSGMRPVGRTPLISKSGAQRVTGQTFRRGND